jgi:DNA polymerase III epsilon subunit-like protein
LGLHPGRANLAACCHHFGIEMERHHAALSDARATAELLAVFLGDAQERGHRLLKEIGLTQRLPAAQEWPSLEPSGRAHLRRGQLLPGAVCLEPLDTLGDYRDLDDLDVVREPVIDVL